MQKNKRKQFKIKEMKKDGLSYPEIGEKIREEKKMSAENKKFIRDILKEKPKTYKYNVGLGKEIIKKESIWIKIKKFIISLFKK